MFGFFNYRDTGIMDRTHLRFFTQKTIKDLITSSDYQIEEERFIFNKKASFIKGNSKNIFLHIIYRLLSVQFVFKIAKNDQ